MRKQDNTKKVTILNFINEYYGRHGIVPAVHDICIGTGIPNTTVHRYLVSMRESGELNYSGRRSIGTTRMKKERDHYSMPVTLWVDFKYNHYLVNENKQRVGYKFYWVDFESFPVFDNWDNLPVIELPVRTEHYTMEEILASFIEAITCYFAWLTNTIRDDYQPEADVVEEILQAYFKEDA